MATFPDVSITQTRKTAVAVNFQKLYPPNQQSSCLNKGTFLGFPGTKLQKFQQQQVAAKRTGSNSSNEDVTVREVVFLLGEEEELSHQAGRNCAVCIGFHWPLEGSSKAVEGMEQSSSRMILRAILVEGWWVDIPQLSLSNFRRRKNEGPKFP